MDRQTKEKLKDDFSERFVKSQGAVVAEYRGLTVGEITDLRRALKAAKCDFKVIKNRVAKKAIEANFKDGESLKEFLKGPIGIAYINGDVALAAKSLLKFEDEHANFVVKKGLVGSKLMSREELKVISSLPSREVLLGTIIGSLVAPHRGLLYALNGISSNLVRVISAIKDKKPA